jgi:hypothetical protein
MLQKKWLMAALFVYGLFGEGDRGLRRLDA